MSKPFPIDQNPGIQRDGTQLDANRSLDSLWARWRLGRPRKMGGYSLISNGLTGLPQKCHMIYLNGQVICHIGTSAGIQQVVFDRFGNFVSIADRTPVDFPATADIGYTMDALFDTTSGVLQLVVHGVPDTLDASSSQTAPPYIGPATATTPLTLFGNPNPPTNIGGQWSPPMLSGGIFCTQPILFGFGNNGLVQWTAPNQPLYLGVTQGSSGAGQAYISAQKIVAGIPLRGGGVYNPAALIWSLSEVIVASFIGSPAWFSFSIMSSSSSILSTDCVIEYDGLYYWPGVDRFMVFNGTVSEVPNFQNQDWFYDNLTPGFEARTFAFKVPRYGEIWWCAPMFGNTQPSHAIILNLREGGIWYDTALPEGGRGAGYFAQGVPFPVMTGVEPWNGGGYPLWKHETGTDRVAGNSVSAVRSYFVTSLFGGPKNNPPDNKGLSFHRFEPDIIQMGDLTIQQFGQMNARAPVVAGPSVTLPAVPGKSQETVASFTPTIGARLNKFQIESNVVGGSYIVGRNLGHADAEGERITP